MNEAPECAASVDGSAAIKPEIYPFFSIITCTLNSAAYLEQTISSVEIQDFKNFEHIFIDAFSSDETVSMISAYQKRSSSRVVLHQAPAKGISNAMNTGVRVAQGEVILHLHGDDCLASSMVLGIVRRHFLTSKASIVVGNCMLMSNGDARHTWPENPLKRAVLKTLLFPLMFYSNLIPHPSAYVSKSVFQSYGGFDDRYRVVMDYEFWFRVLGNESIALIDDTLSKYRFHSCTVSSQQMALGLLEIEKIRGRYKHVYIFAYYFFKVFLLPILTIRRTLSLTRSKK